MGMVIKGGQCFYHKWDISGEATGLTPAPQLEIKEWRPFNNTAVRKVAGLRNDSLSLEGVLSLADTTGTAFFDEQGNEHPLTMHLNGTSPAEGDEAVIAAPINVKIDNPMVQGDLHAFTLNGDIDGVTCPGISFGFCLAIGTKTSSGNSAAGITMPAVSAGQTVVAALHVTGSPTGTMDMIIESAASGDPSFSSPTTRFTFTQVTTSATSEYLTLFSAAGITDTLWRANWTSASTPSDALSVAVGIV